MGSSRGGIHGGQPRQPAVDHEGHVGDRDGRLGDGSGEDHLRLLPRVPRAAEAAGGWRLLRRGRRVRRGRERWGSLEGLALLFPPGLRVQSDHPIGAVAPSAAAAAASAAVRLHLRLEQFRHRSNLSHARQEHQRRPVVVVVVAFVVVAAAAAAATALALLVALVVVLFVVLIAGACRRCSVAIVGAAAAKVSVVVPPQQSLDQRTVHADGG